MHTRLLFAALVILESMSSAQTLTWTQIKPATSPSPRSCSGAVCYDSVRNRLVMFGGLSGNTYLNDTWEYDGKNWNRVTPTTPPVARYAHAIAYDSARKRIVLFGGFDGKTGLDDTWEYDGANWSRSRPTRSPIARWGIAMTYDTARQRVVLFGGYDAGRFDDTWEYDGTNWTEITPVARPPARNSHALAYDSARQRVVMFGGDSNSSTQGLLGDTWEYDGATWAQVSPSSSPSPRRDHAMVYDAIRKQVLLYGGWDLSFGFSDTWEYHATNWKQSTPRSSPGARYYFAMGFDTARDRAVLFGGDNGKGVINETWEYTPPLFAAFSNFGKGCSSLTRNPTITSTSTPKLGSTFPLTIQGFLPKLQAGLLAFGASDKVWGNIPLPMSLNAIGMNGCNLFSSIDTMQAVLLGWSGSLTLQLQIPNKPSLLGATVYGQAVAPDPKANVAGAATTNAFKAIVGY